MEPPSARHDVAQDFEAWASLAARLRVSRAQDRRALLQDAGLEDRWDAIHEEWARRLNAEIAAGALERPHRYLDLCAAEVRRTAGAVAATLPGVELDASDEVIPFAPSESQRLARATSSASAGFAALRATGAAPAAPLPEVRGRAETLPLLDARALFLTPPPSSGASGEPSRPPADSSAMSERVLADFRASLVPGPVHRPNHGQEHTAVGVDPLLLRASAMKVRELLEEWSSDRLASVLDLAARAGSLAEEEAIWQREGILTAGDRDLVRKRFASRIASDSALGFRWPAVVAWLRRG